MKSKKVSVIVSGLLIFLMLNSCGKKDESSSQENAAQKSSQSSEMAAAEKAGDTAKGKIDGQFITVDQFKFVIPKDWKGDKDTQVWFPDTEDANKPIPDRSLHHGARPLMGIPSLEKGIQTHIGLEPVDKKPVKVGNMQGIICQWQRGSYKSIGLFLLEKSAGMDIMYFFICQAPATLFDQNLETYKKILASVSLK